MNASTLSLVPLQQASLCLDCDMITTGHTYCSACGSTGLLNLARTLSGRKCSAGRPDGFTAVAPVSLVTILNSELPQVGIWRSATPDDETPRFDKVSAVCEAKQQRKRWRYLLREAGSVIHRVATVLIAVAIVGGSTAARSESVSATKVMGASGKHCSPPALHSRIIA